MNRKLTLSIVAAIALIVCLLAGCSGGTAVDITNRDPANDEMAADTDQTPAEEVDTTVENAADETATDEEPAEESTDEEETPEPPPRPAPKVEGEWLQISPTDEVWVDKTKKVVRVDGEVCNHRGQLEMFICPQGTKDYESVVAVRSKAQMVHVALLAIGAKPGKPVSFDPEYVGASGDIINVMLAWVDENGDQKQTRGQEWVRHYSTKKELEHEWVFAGSLFWKDPDTGKSYYQAEGGDLICVSNFATATMDLPIKSSKEAADGLLYEPFTERLPPVRTPVSVLLSVKAPSENTESGSNPQDAVEANDSKASEPEATSEPDSEEPKPAD